MAAATPTAAPRRHAGRTGAPRCVSGGLRPRQRAQTHLATGRAERARRRPPRMARRDGRRSRTAGTSATRTGDAPTASVPAHARHRGTDPRAGHHCLSPGTATHGQWREGHSTTSHAMAILPAAHGWHHTTRTHGGGRRRAGCVRHHGGTPTPNDGGGPPRPAEHGGRVPGTANRLPGPADQLPPPTAPHPSPSPAPGAGPLRDPRRTGADGRGGIGGDTTPGPGSARSRGESPAPAHAHSI